MGGCTSAKSTNPTSFSEPSASMIQREGHKWAIIEAANFDTEHFKFAISIQELYSELYGAFLLPDRVANLVLEFKRFMYLQTRNKQEGGPPLVASPVVDRIWRLLISNTQVYINFCHRVFGGVLHRSTANPPDIKGYHHTLQLYAEDFDQNNVDWPPFGTVQSLQQSQEGFLYIRSAEFIDFHNDFSSRYRGFQDFENLPQVYTSELKKLRDHTQRKIQLSELGKRKPVPRVMTRSIIEKKAEKDFEEEEEQFYNIRTSRIESAQPDKANTMKHFSVSIKLTSKKSEGDVKNIRARTQLIKMFSQEENSISFVERKNSVSKDGDPFGSNASLYDEETLEQGRLKYDFKLLKKKWEELKPVRTKLDSQAVPPVVLQNFASDFNTDSRLTERVAREYRRWLLIHRAGKTDQEFCPPLWVKYFWDAHIAETEAYLAFCEKVFGSFIHSVHYAREVSDEQIDKYERTLWAYRELFEEEPDPQVWPSPDDRFDDDINYSYKMFNVRGYMSEVVNRVEAQVLGQKRVMRETLEGRGLERAEMRERKRAMAKMAANVQPDKGSEHIHIGSPTLEVYEGVDVEETEV